MVPGALATATLLALAVIVAAAQATGALVQRVFRQPPVVGEMIAGVLLGPSLLGLVWPAAEARLFPAEERALLFALAQLGVGLYMFVVGLGFRREVLREQARAAAAVSVAGIAVPFVAAAALAPWLVARGDLFGPGMGDTAAALFLGACIAITAFPMLARIIHERGLSGTRLGTLALAAGAINDAGAWVVLAVVLATAGGGTVGLGWTLGGAAAFAAAALALGPRLLAPLGRLPAGDGLSMPRLAIALLLFLLAAFAMEAIGMHAVFGGFLLGVAMPRGAFADGLRAGVEPLTAALLLPVFFTQSGLNTRLDLLLSPGLALVAAAVIAVAVIAKFGACWAAARLAGEPAAVAIGLGALMNARGLMELIIINIGLQHGLITPALFSVLALMAVVTTFAAAPLFALARPTS